MHKVMTDQEKEVAKQILSKKYLDAREQCESPSEVKMLDKKYNENIQKVENGINPFDTPDNSPY